MFLEDGENISRRFDAGYAGRESAVERQVVKSDGELLSCAGDCKSENNK